jgi:hypothetical protein
VGALLIFIVGCLASLNLPEERSKIRIQKFGAVALALIAFGLPILKPFISSYSSVSFLEELKTEKLSTPEDLVRFETEQARQFEQLKEEVKALREDIYYANLYYGSIIQIFGSLIGIFAVNFAFRKRKNEDSEEIKQDQILKL